jgi:hypothetical protein
MANPRGQQRDKPFRDALRMAIADAEGDFAKLRKVANALVKRGTAGDVQAIKEIADRLDGKVPTAIVGDEEYAPVQFEEIRRVLVGQNAHDQDSEDIRPATH